jgi:hypothetical protein
MKLFMLLLSLSLNFFLTAQQTSVRLGTGLAGFPQNTVETGASVNLDVVQDFNISGPVSLYLSVGAIHNRYTDRSAFVPNEVQDRPCDCILARYNTYGITRSEAYFGGGLKYTKDRFTLRAGANLGYAFSGEITETRFRSGSVRGTPQTSKPGERFEEIGRSTEVSMEYNRRFNPITDLAISYQLNNRFSVGLRYQETLGRYRITKTQYNACSFCRPRRENGVREIGNAGFRSLQVAAEYRLRDAN